jgi:hypothetical protein
LGEGEPSFQVWQFLVLPAHPLILCSPLINSPLIIMFTAFRLVHHESCCCMTRFD